jgi:hypothetical protein
MRINELLVEEQIDELSLAPIGRGIGKVASGVGKVVGGVKGAVQGAKNAYAQGKNQAYQGTLNTVSGGAPQAGGGQPVATPAQNGTTQTTAPQAGTTNTQQTTQPSANTQPQAAGTSTTPQQASQQQTAQAPTAPQGQTNTAEPNGRVEPKMDNTPPAQGGMSTQTPTAPANNEPPGMKGPEIAAELDKVWKKATANQGSMTGSPQVRNQITAMAKGAGMTGQTIPESKQVGYRSRFLGLDI